MHPLRLVLLVAAAGFAGAGGMWRVGADQVAPIAAADPELSRVRLGRGDSMPRVERQTLPPYPENGPVVLAIVDTEVVVGTNGRVIHARGIPRDDRDADSARLEDACLTAVRSWRFRPAEFYGQREPVLIGVEFEFVPGARAERKGRVQARVRSLPRVPPSARVSDGVGPVLDLLHASKETLADPQIAHPVPIRSVLPEYTAAAARTGTQGRVEIEALVAPDGTVAAASILKSLDDRNGLDAEALIAARYWLFTPPQQAGRSVAATLRLTLDFTLR
jgi:TonB family protein